jgi:hypothetical protein
MKKDLRQVECVPGNVNQAAAMDAFACAESMAERFGVRIYVRANDDGGVTIIRADDCSDEDKEKSLAFFDPIT